MHPIKVLYYSKFQKVFPPIKYAFAYGSAVFKQRGKEKGKMLDLIFAVEDPVEWHKENLIMNNDHYSFLRYLGPQKITALQNYPAGVYYNTLVRIQSQVVKYGVISVKNLLHDLYTWEWLYISGRLHKPVLTLTDHNDDQNLVKALAYNLKCAAICGVLLQRSNIFSAEDLYLSICGLSYQGDFRMVVGEDREKIYNIVGPHLEYFDELYSSYLDELVEILPGGMMRKKPTAVVQNWSEELPETLVALLTNGKELQKALESIVAASSLQQSLKGILTAGGLKTVKYSMEKLKKMIASFKHTSV